MPANPGRAAGKLVGIAALVAASLAMAVLLAEVSVRILAPQQLILIRPDLWQPADTVGWAHRPDVSVRINTGERAVTVFTDHQGFRVGKDGPTKAATEVLLLGDSFMEALQVEHEETTAYLLERTLSRLLARPVGVRNAGVVGWDPNQYLLRARQLLEQNRFALVVVAIFVGNDAVSERVDYMRPRAPVRRAQFRFPRSLSRADVVDALFAPVNDGLEVRSHLYTLLKHQLSVLRMRLGLTAQYFPVEYLASEVNSPRWRVTADLSRDLAGLAAQHGAPTLFVLIPYHFQVYEQAFYEYVRGFGIAVETVDIDQPSRRLYQELAARGLEVIDALPSFRAAARAGTQLFGSVDTHLSPAGHAQLAELVGPRAARLLSPTPSRHGGRTSW